MIRSNFSLSMSNSSPSSSKRDIEFPTMEENKKRNLSTNFHPLEIFSLLLFLLLLSQKERKATIPLVLVLVLVVVGVRVSKEKEERESVFLFVFSFRRTFSFLVCFLKKFSFSHPKLVKKNFGGRSLSPLVGVIVLRLIFFIAFQRGVWS